MYRISESLQISPPLWHVRRKVIKTVQQPISKPVSGGMKVRQLQVEAVPPVRKRAGLRDLDRDRNIGWETRRACCRRFIYLIVVFIPRPCSLSVSLLRFCIFVLSYSLLSPLTSMLSFRLLNEKPTKTNKHRRIHKKTDKCADIARQLQAQ